MVVRRRSGVELRTHAVVGAVRSSVDVSTLGARGALCAATDEVGAERNAASGNVAGARVPRCDAVERMGARSDQCDAVERMGARSDQCDAGSVVGVGFQSASDCDSGAREIVCGAVHAVGAESRAASGIDHGARGLACEASAGVGAERATASGTRNGAELATVSEVHNGAEAGHAGEWIGGARELECAASQRLGGADETGEGLCVGSAPASGSNDDGVQPLRPFQIEQRARIIAAKAFVADMWRKWRELSPRENEIQLEVTRTGEERGAVKDNANEIRSGAEKPFAGDTHDGAERRTANVSAHGADDSTANEMSHGAERAFASGKKTGALGERNGQAEIADAGGFGSGYFVTFADAATFKLHRLAASVEKYQQLRVAEQNRGALPEFVERLTSLEQLAAHTLTRALREHALWPWLKELPGMGGVHVAAVLGIMRTPWRFKGPRSLWHYLGLHVVDGRLPRKRKGQRCDWHPRGRGHVLQPGGVAEMIVRVGAAQKGRPATPYRLRYDAAKLRLQRERGVTMEGEEVCST